MSQELANLQMPESLTLGPVTDTDLESFGTGSAFFSRLQLCGATSNYVQEHGVSQGSYVFIRSKDDFIDLGPEVDILVCGLRLKAMRFENDEVQAVFDINDPEFKAIRELAGTPNSGCMAGPEFLIWVPEKKAFATLYLGSKSFAAEAPKIRAAMVDGRPGPITLKSRLAKTKKFRWQVPVAVQCSSPFDLPDQESFITAIDKFLNPPKNEVERVTEPTRDR